MLRRGMQLRGLVKNLDMGEHGKEQGKRTVTYCLRKAAWRRPVTRKQRDHQVKTLMGLSNEPPTPQKGIQSSAISRKSGTLNMPTEQREMPLRKRLSLPNFPSMFLQEANPQSSAVSSDSCIPELIPQNQRGFLDRPPKGLLSVPDMSAITQKVFIQTSDTTGRTSPPTTVPSNKCDLPPKKLLGHPNSSSFMEREASIQTSGDSPSSSKTMTLRFKQRHVPLKKLLVVPDASPIVQKAFIHSNTCPPTSLASNQSDQCFKKLLHVHNGSSIKQVASIQTSAVLHDTCIPTPLAPKCGPANCAIPVPNIWKDCKVRKRPKWEGCDKICMPCCCPAFSPPDCDTIEIRHNTCKRPEYRIPSFVECRKVPLGKKSKKECCYQEWPCPEAGLETIIEPLIRTKHRQEAILGRRTGNLRV